MMVALLFYGYATGVFSSRKLEQATYDSVAFRYITGDEHPDHDTIANFRKRFLGELEGLFKQVLEMAAELGTVRLGRVSLDGTKMQGNASKHKAMSWGHANKLERQLEGEVQTLLKLAQQADQEAEAEQQELDIPEELQRREERLAAIRDAKEKIEARAQERHAVERAEYEEKLKRRQERAAATGKKVGGKPPKEPEAGLRGAEAHPLPIPFADYGSAQYAFIPISFLMDHGIGSPPQIAWIYTAAMTLTSAG